MSVAYGPGAVMKCFFIPWRPRRRRRAATKRDVVVNPANSSPCSSPSRYAAQSSLRMRFDGGGIVAPVGVGSTAHKFTLAQLSAATSGFRNSNLVGEGGFGKVYRGRLAIDGGHVAAAAAAAAGAEDLEVAVKQLRRGGAQGTHEFLVECSMLMQLHHPNLVSLVGYCAQAQERLLVYEFLPRGSLDAHLFFNDSSSSKNKNNTNNKQQQQQLSWDARIKVAVGAARGLRYLHEVPVIYRDLKSSNILLADDMSPKLSDLGLAKLGPVGDDTHVSTRVMGTYGYCAPDYAVTGKLSVKSDVYSFGVVLLELITGRRAFHDAAAAAANKREREEQRLLVWARPYLQQLKDGRHGRMSRCLAIEGLADPALQGRYPRRGLYQVAIIASLCLHDKPNLRPTMSDVTKALEHVASQSRPTHGSMDDA